MENSLTLYGDRDAIRELADRIKLMLPGGQRYNSAEALTLAQLAIAHELDPFAGEVWLLKKKSGEVIGSAIGLKGFRKHAKRQAQYWGRFLQVEAERYAAPKGSICYEYHLRDQESFQAWSRSLLELVKGGIPYQAALELVGEQPITVGVGIWTPGEETRMKPAQAAQFRAEKDALKRRFDVLFKNAQGGLPVTIVDDEPLGDIEESAELEHEASDAEFIEGEFTDESAPPEPEAPPDGPEPSKPAPRAIAGRLVELGLSENIPAARALIKRLNLAELPESEAVKLARVYRGFRDTGLGVGDAVAAVQAGKVPV